MSISFYFYLFLIAVLSVVVSLGGSRWIERLYRKNKDILTFPDDVVSRGRWRPYLLGIAFLACGVRFFFLTSGLPLVFMLYAAALLLLMTATDFEQYCLFDEMMIPFALGGHGALRHVQDPLLGPSPGGRCRRGYFLYYWPCVPGCSRRRRYQAHCLSWPLAGYRCPVCGIHDWDYSGRPGGAPASSDREEKAEVRLCLWTLFCIDHGGTVSDSGIISLPFNCILKRGRSDVKQDS